MYEAGERRVRLGAFLRGLLAGAGVSAAVALVAIVATSSPETDPAPDGPALVEEARLLSAGPETADSAEATPAPDSTGVAAASEGEVAPADPEAPAPATAMPADPGEVAVVEWTEAEATGQPLVRDDGASAPADAIGAPPVETGGDGEAPEAVATADEAPTVVVLHEAPGGGAEAAAEDEPGRDAAAEVEAPALAEADAAMDSSATSEVAGSEPDGRTGARFVAAPQPTADPPGASAEGEPDAAAEADDSSIAMLRPDSGGPTQAEDTAGAAEAREDAGAPIANAQPFDAPRGAPLMAVVLVGEGVEALSAEQLQTMPMPLTIAIPQDAARAAEIAAAARAAGHEVVADLSPSGRPSAGLAEALETAVGATTTGGGGTAPELLEPVMAELSSRGLAWIDTGAGIGSPAERTARQTGVAYTQANRTVPADADADALRRGIESAAHQARQWGTAVLFLGTSEPALQALIRWGLEEGGGPVRFAPVSAVIERRAAL